MKTKNISSTDWTILIGLGFFIFLMDYIVPFAYTSKTELYKKSERQINWYKNHMDQPIYISNEMCQNYRQKGLNCSWGHDQVYFFISAKYKQNRKQWILTVKGKHTLHTQEISTESVRIQNNTIFDTEKYRYIDTKQAQKLHPRARFVENRAYYFIELENEKILVLDHIGNQVFLPKSIITPLPPNIE